MPREFILSYIFVVISAVQMLKIMEKILKQGVKGFIKPLHLQWRESKVRNWLETSYWGDLKKRELSRLKLKPNCLLFTCSYSILPLIR